MSRALLARRERDALCDLALVLGEDAPTLCDPWTAKDLVCHLLVRERSPLAGVGLMIPPLSGLSEQAMARLGRKDFRVLVERLRGHGLTPMALPPVDKLFNTVEYFVHHEDLRRAQDDWEPRELAEKDRDELWRVVKGYGGRLVKDAGVPVSARRTDTGKTVTLRKGPDPVVIAGPPAEVLFFLFGRDQTSDVTFAGSGDAVEAVRSGRSPV
jgi:uncharacterized protein (TIGR03085 family)